MIMIRKTKREDKGKTRCDAKPVALMSLPGVRLLVGLLLMVLRTGCYIILNRYSLAKRG